MWYQTQRDTWYLIYIQSIKPKNRQSAADWTRLLLFFSIHIDLLDLDINIIFYWQRRNIELSKLASNMNNICIDFLFRRWKIAIECLYKFMVFATNIIILVVNIVNIFLVTLLLLLSFHPSKVKVYRSVPAFTADKPNIFLVFFFQNHRNAEFWLRSYVMPNTLIIPPALLHIVCCPFDSVIFICSHYMNPVIQSFHTYFFSCAILRHIRTKTCTHQIQPK